MYGSRQAPLLRLSAVALVLVSGAMLGCNAEPVNQQDHRLRDDLAAIRALHGDSTSIGAMDATAPPADLTQYRRPAVRPLKAKPGI